jgi:multiple sugar transport system permease protein
MVNGRSQRGARIFTMVFLVVMAAIWVFPLIWVLSSSLKPESDVIANPLTWIPQTFTLDNYTSVLTNTENSPILRWFGNSLFIATIHTALMLLFNAMSAYAFARMKFPGREPLFWLLMLTMMFPAVLNYIPLYAIVDSLGWVDTPWAMIFPGLGSVFGIFLLRQFFIGIPAELEEAARIDGANSWQIFTRIILPLSKPALVTLAIFTFMANWNDFLWPLIVTNDLETRTLPVGLSLLQGYYNIQFGKLTASTVISAIPVLIVFLFAQRFFIKGITLSGIKG